MCASALVRICYFTALDWTWLHFVGPLALSSLSMICVGLLGPLDYFHGYLFLPRYSMLLISVSCTEFQEPAENNSLESYSSVSILSIPLRSDGQSKL